MAKNLWDKRRNLSYLKVGMFFLIGFLLFFFALISMKDTAFFQPANELIIVYDFAEGLRHSSPVRFCGVDVGEVRRVEIVKKESADGIIYLYKDRPRVKVYAGIDQDVEIPKNSKFIINSLSLFGEKYLEIIPPEEPEGFIADGDTVEGISPIPLFTLFSDFDKTMHEVEAFVKDGTIKTSLENSLSNMEDVTANLNGLLEDTRNQSGTIGKLFYDDSLYVLTEEFIADLKAHPWKLLNKPRERRRK